MGGRLQKAHDYVEAHGFDIMKYGPGMNGQCCFIGAVKVVGGEPGEPAGEAAPDYVAKALCLMDDVILREHPSDEFRRLGDYPGSDVEGWGMGTLRYKPSSDQSEEALPIYRKALREVYNEIERRENTK